MALSIYQTRQVVNLLRKIKPTSFGLPEEVFQQLIRLVPFVALELVLVNRRGEILLTWRGDKYWHGWHFPGGLLRYRETFFARLQKTARREVGVKLKSCRFLALNNYVHGRRSHDVSLIFWCRYSGKIKHGKFFSAMPKDIIPEHKWLWRKAKTELR